MGIEMKFVTFFVILAVFVLVQETDAATYVVGDSLGWTIPSGGAAAYVTWAAKNTYAPGDVLVFNFAVGIHDVATVTKASYDSCSSNGALSLSTVSPTNITLTTAGTYYFICTFGQHCSLGQKLTLTVTSAATTPPTAATAPPTSATKPPPTATTPPTAAAKPPTTATTPPTAAAKPPTAATAPPTSGSLTPASATKPPTAATPEASTTNGAPASIPPTSAAPTPAPAASLTPGSGAPAPGPGTGAAGVPSTGSPPPPGGSASPPAPGSASRKGVAPLAIGFVLVVMGVVF